MFYSKKMFVFCIILLYFSFIMQLHGSRDLKIINGVYQLKTLT